MSRDGIEAVFPRLRDEGYERTSQESNIYNCIAWALDDTEHWWDPTLNYGCYWSPNVPRDNRIETIVRIFQARGYTVCTSEELEVGYEKIAIYQRPNTGVTHASRQLPSGQWTSKLGDWEDITHSTPQSVECELYGTVVQIMKRRRNDWD